MRNLFGRGVKLAWEIENTITQTKSGESDRIPLINSAIAFSKKRSAPIILYKVHIINAP